jgi:hypothetical protein
MWWFLIVPFAILAATIAGVSVLVAVFTSVGAWPWLLVAVGMWLIWQDRRRTHRNSDWHEHGRRRARSAPASRADPRQPSAPTTPALPDRNRRQQEPVRRPELPIDVKVKVEQIRRKVDVLLSYADRFPPMSHDLYLVRQTAGEYLPRTVEAYLSLPTETVEGVFPTDGMSAHQELREQLELLDTKLDEIAQDLQRQDMDRLLANRRFLEARFKSEPGESDQAKDEPSMAVA